MSDADRLKYDALTRQLDRMRAMQDAYHRKFFTLLLATSITGAIALAVPTIFTLAFVCFGLVTTGVTAAFFLHFADFARTNARALESRLNQVLGEPLLLAAELEGDYFYPHEQPRPAALTVTLEWPSTFFTFFTLHFCGVWVMAIVFAGYRLWHGVEAPTFFGILLVFTVWTLLNLMFLRHWFRGDAERRVAARLREAYGRDVPKLSL